MEKTGESVTKKERKYGKNWRKFGVERETATQPPPPSLW